MNKKVKSKKVIKTPQESDNLSISASFDDVISVSMGQQPKQKKTEQQNVTPKKNKNK